MISVSSVDYYVIIFCNYEYKSLTKIRRPKIGYETQPKTVLNNVEKNNKRKSQ
jgi:hypothetical protein